MKEENRTSRLATKTPDSVCGLIWLFLKDYKIVITIFVFLAFIAGLWGPINSMLVKQVINLLPVAQGDNAYILFWPTTYIVLNFVVLDNFTWRGIGYINYKYQAEIKNKIYLYMIDRILLYPYHFFQKNLSGRLSNQLQVMIDSLELILHRISVDFIRAISLLIASFIVSYTVSSIFCIVLLIWFICFTSFSLWMSSKIIILSSRHADNLSNVSGQSVDIISNAGNIRIFSQQAYEINRFGQFLKVILGSFQKKSGYVVFLCSVQGIMIAVMMSFCAYYLVNLYKLGAINMGDFALIYSLSMELGYMMWYTMSRVDEFNEAYGKFKQAYIFLMTESPLFDRLDAKELKSMDGRITFNNVSFKYNSKGFNFDKLSVVIEPKQKVGLVGYSGGGKSSFVNLILRLHEINSGKITIDDNDISCITHHSLCENITYIPQEPIFFHRSILDNIRYGNLSATEEEIIEASKKAGAHNFIQELPEGYNTFVGERGVKLSGGQRQRISIARAMLKKSSILIMDEVTSNLDSITENLIQENLHYLMQDRTTLIIAHRLSTILNMDRILVFSDGKIVEDGSHNQLMVKNGLYRKLWNSQIGSFLGDAEE